MRQQYKIRLFEYARYIYTTHKGHIVNVILLHITTSFVKIADEI